MLIVINRILHKIFSPGRTFVSVRVIILLGMISLACSTRVSEWVLLNASPEKYTLICYDNSPMSDAAKKQNSILTDNFKLANLNVSRVLKEDIKQPYYALFYKNRLLEKFNNYEDIKHIATSPMREKIADELLGGKLCVMLYLKTGDDVKDKNRLLILQNAIKNSPFKDIISIVELDRKNRAETHFTSLLLNVEDDLKNINEPMLFGIFGKFKALEPLLAGGISEENINLMIKFLIAECSCLIKDDLPGTDILYSGIWENPKPALLNKMIDLNPSLGK